jgi:hypothetical protein
MIGAAQRRLNFRRREVMQLERRRLEAVSFGCYLRRWPQCVSIARTLLALAASLSSPHRPHAPPFLCCKEQGRLTVYLLFASCFFLLYTLPLRKCKERY